MWRSAMSITLHWDANPQFRNCRHQQIPFLEDLQPRRLGAVVTVVSMRVSRGTEREAQIHNRLVHHMPNKRFEPKLSAAVRLQA